MCRSPSGSETNAIVVCRSCQRVFTYPTLGKAMCRGLQRMSRKGHEIGVSCRSGCQRKVVLAPLNCKLPRIRLQRNLEAHSVAFRAHESCSWPGLTPIEVTTERLVIMKHKCEGRFSFQFTMENYNSPRWKKLFRKLATRNGRGALRVLKTLYGKAGGLAAYRAFTAPSN